MQEAMARESLDGQQVSNGETGVRQMVQENAVIVIGKRDCCMSHVLKRLLIGLGVNPAVFDIDKDQEGAVVDELLKIGGGDKEKEREKEKEKESEIKFPVVFVGGKLFGGMDKVMSTHISGELVPILKEAGALWL